MNKNISTIVFDKPKNQEKNERKRKNQPERKQTANVYTPGHRGAVNFN